MPHLRRRPPRRRATVRPLPALPAGPGAAIQRSRRDRAQQAEASSKTRPWLRPRAEVHGLLHGGEPNSVNGIQLPDALSFPGFRRKLHRPLVGLAAGKADRHRRPLVTPPGREVRTRAEAKADSNLPAHSLSLSPAVRVVRYLNGIVSDSDNWFLS